MSEIDFNGMIDSRPQTVAAHQGLGSADQVAQEFEAILVAYMFKVMRESVQSGGLFDEQPPGSDIYLGMMDQELGRALSKKGGLGLAQTLQEYLHQQIPSRTAGARSVLKGNVLERSRVNGASVPAEHGNIQPADAPDLGPRADTRGPKGEDQGNSDRAEHAISRASHQADRADNKGLGMAGRERVSTQRWPEGSGVTAGVTGPRPVNTDPKPEK
jgi:Rod binding domain-containing protein